MYLIFWKRGVWGGLGVEEEYQEGDGEGQMRWGGYRGEDSEGHGEG